MKLDIILHASFLVFFSATVKGVNSPSIEELSISVTDIVLPEYQEPLPFAVFDYAPTASFYQKSTKTIFAVNYAGTFTKVTDGSPTLTTIGSGLGTLAGVCGDPSGNIYISSRSNNAIYKYNSAGTLIGTTTNWGTPYAIFCDSLGNVFVPARDTHRIQKQSSTGVVSLVVGTGIAGSADGNVISATVDNPVGVALNAAGDVFFTQQGGKMRMLKNSVVSTIAGSGGSGAVPAGPAGGLAKSYSFSNLRGIWVSAQGDIFFTDGAGAHKVYLLKKDTSGGYDNSYMYLVAGSARKTAYTLYNPVHIFGDDATGTLYVSDSFNANRVAKLVDPDYAVSAPSVSPSATPSIKPTVAPSRVPSATPSIKPTVVPSDVPTVTPSAAPSIVPTSVPSSAPSACPSSSPSVVPSSVPSEAPTLAVPEYSLTVSAKSFKYFEVKVFAEANERVFPVNYELVDCPENAGAVIWGHESTPITEDTNTCVYGLPRHYWCECPTLVNGNKPKLTLNFGGTVFDRIELLILDWVDGELTVSDSANNIVLFSASRAGGPLAGEEFVAYDHLNLLQIAPSVAPTVAPSSVPTTKPSWTPTTKPTIPSIVPTQTPTVAPTTTAPSAEPSVVPSMVPSAAPSFTAQYTITLTAKTFKYFEVRVYTHDNLRIFPVSYELEHCPENAGVAVWNDQTTEDTNTCVYGYPRNFWCHCAAVADAKPKLVLHMGHTVFDRVELLLLNWEDGEVMVTDEANHETFLSATHDGVGSEFVTFGNLNLEHAAAPVRRLLRGG